MSSSDLGTGLTDPDSFFSRIFHYNDNDDYYNDGVDKERKAKMPPYHRAEVGMEARGQIDRNRSSVGKDPGRSPGGPGRHDNEDLHDYDGNLMIMIMMNIKLNSLVADHYLENDILWGSSDLDSLKDTKVAPWEDPTIK